MDQRNFRDDLFDNAAGEWVQSHIDEHFRQRYLREEGPIYCETLMTIHGTTDADVAITLIRGPWDWWEHGRITDFTINGDGSSDQVLSPVWWFITRVGLHIFPPVDLPELKGRRVPLLLTEHFTGWSSMDVYPNARGDAMTIRGRFHGVEYHVPAIPNKLAEGLHLDAESGTMPIPFPKGTGWVGLLHKLEARSPVENAICGPIAESSTAN
jgi:hypothetical protein